MKTCLITESGETLLHYVVKWEHNENVRDFLMKCGQISSRDFVMLRASYPVEPLVRKLWAPVSLLSLLDKNSGSIYDVKMECRLSECSPSLSPDELLSEGLGQFGGDYLEFSFGRSGWKNPGTDIHYHLHFNVRPRYKESPGGLKEFDVKKEDIISYQDSIPEKDVEAIIAAFDILGVNCRFNGRNFRIDKRTALLLTTQKQADMYKFAAENDLETSLRSTRPYFSSAAASHIKTDSVLQQIEFSKSMVWTGLNETDMEKVISYFEKIDGTPKGKEWAVSFLGGK